MVAFAARNGATDDQLESIRLAISEAVTNAIIHGYHDGGGTIQITAAVTADGLWVLVADDGGGFQMPSATPGLGWGMPLIAHASDEFVIAERAYGGTELRMRFTLGDRTGASPD